MPGEDDSITAELSSRDLEELPSELVDRELPAPLGMYVLLHRLAESETVQVFLAVATELEPSGQLCVLKRVRRDVAAVEGFEERFTDAMRRLVHFDHRNVAQVFDTSQVDGDFFLAREYVIGCTLEEALSAGQDRGASLPLDLSLLIVVDAMRGLYHALRQLGPDGGPLRLWHGRLRARSVLLSARGEVKVIGFDREWEPSGSSGDLDWIAPEIARGEEGGPRSDVFAVGRLLQQLLRRPEDSKAGDATRRIHPALQPLVERATAEDPSIDPEM